MNDLNSRRSCLTINLPSLIMSSKKFRKFLVCIVRGLYRVRGFLPETLSKLLSIPSFNTALHENSSQRNPKVVEHHHSLAVLHKVVQSSVLFLSCS